MSRPIHTIMYQVESIAPHSVLVAKHCLLKSGDDVQVEVKIMPYQVRFAFDLGMADTEVTQWIGFTSDRTRGALASPW